MGSTSVSAGMVTSYTRAFLPLALIVTGLIIALVGAGSVAGSKTTVETATNFANAANRTATEAPGSGWGYVVVGGLVFLAGCTMQVLTWRFAVRTAKADAAARAMEGAKASSKAAPEVGAAAVKTVSPMPG